MEAGLTLNVQAASDDRREKNADGMDVGDGMNRSASSSPIAHTYTKEATGGSSDTASGDSTSERQFNVDADAVGQILFNLVDNACKYASGDDVTQRIIDIDARMNGPSVRISVRDHGPGVPASCARTIFKPFDRGRYGPGDTTPGVGLGLALARGLARDLGGDLTLENSAANPGATFVVSLPM
jgi:K+-sensing histidine kinase KdpD